MPRSHRLSLALQAGGPVAPRRTSRVGHQWQALEAQAQCPVATGCPALSLQAGCPVAPPLGGPVGPGYVPPGRRLCALWLWGSIFCAPMFHP